MMRRKMRHLKKRMISVQHFRGYWDFHRSGTHYRFTGDTMMSLVNSKLNLRTESELLNDLIDNARATDTFWDIGTDIGVYSVLVDSHVDQTIGFEPDPIRRCETRQNCFRNDIDIQVLDVALGDGSRIQIDNYDRTHEVDTVIGDEWHSRSEIPSPDILKMDIEGGEYAALANMKSLLDNCRHVYCELHPTMLPQKTPDDVRDVLDEYGSDVRTLFDRGNEVIIRADAASNRPSDS